MRLTSKHILLFLLVIVGMAGTVCGAKSPGVSDDAKAKAAYIFMEASARVADGDYGTAYYMLSRASELNPDDDAIAAELGRIIIYTGLGDSADYEKSYAAIKRVFYKNPADVQNGYAFIDVAQHLRRDADIKAAYKTLMDYHPGNADYALNYAGYRTLDYLAGDSTGPAEAAAIYDRLEAGTGITDILTLHRLRSLAMTRDTTEMIRQIQRFYNTAPLNPQANFYTGSMFDMVNMRDSAIVYYTAACLLDSTFGAAYLAKAEHYLAVGDSARYDAEVVHALESPSLDFESKYEILSGYTRSMFNHDERRSTFLNLFRKMLDIHPGEASLHYLYGMYLGTIDSIGAASEQFGYAMDLDPEQEIYIRYRLQTAVDAEDTATAVATARTAISRFDNVFYPIFGASVLHQTGRSSEAVELLKSYDVERAENDYQKSMYEQTLGDILFAVEQKDSAYAAYDRALVYNPDNIGVLNNLAYFLAVDGRDLDKAEKYVKRALLEEPDNPTYIDTYAWVLFKQKDYTAAKRQIDKALNVYNKYKEDTHADPANGEDISMQVTEDELEEMVTGVTDEEDIAHEDAEIEEITREIIGDVPTSEIYDHAGDIYFMNGEPDLALEFWKEALTLDPDNEKIKKKVTNKAYFFE